MQDCACRRRLASHVGAYIVVETTPDRVLTRRTAGFGEHRIAVLTPA